MHCVFSMLRAHSYLAAAAGRAATPRLLVFLLALVMVLGSCGARAQVVTTNYNAPSPTLVGSYSTVEQGSTVRLPVIAVGEYLVSCLDDNFFVVPADNPTTSTFSLPFGHAITSLFPLGDTAFGVISENTVAVFSVINMTQLWQNNSVGTLRIQPYSLMSSWFFPRPPMVRNNTAFLVGVDLTVLGSSGPGGLLIEFDIMTGAAYDIPTTYPTSNYYIEVHSDGLAAITSSAPPVLLQMKVAIQVYNTLTRTMSNYWMSDTWSNSISVTTLYNGLLFAIDANGDMTTFDYTTGVVSAQTPIGCVTEETLWNMKIVHGELLVFCGTFVGKFAANTTLEPLGYVQALQGNVVVLTEGPLGSGKWSIGDDDGLAYSFDPATMTIYPWFVAPPLGTDCLNECVPQVSGITWVPGTTKVLVSVTATGGRLSRTPGNLFEIDAALGVALFNAGKESEVDPFGPAVVIRTGPAPGVPTYVGVTNLFKIPGGSRSLVTVVDFVTPTPQPPTPDPSPQAPTPGPTPQPGVMPTQGPPTPPPTPAPTSPPLHSYNETFFGSGIGVAVTVSISKSGETTIVRLTQDGRRCVISTVVTCDYSTSPPSNCFFSFQATKDTVPVNDVGQATCADVPLPITKQIVLSYLTVSLSPALLPTLTFTIADSSDPQPPVVTATLQSQFALNAELGVFPIPVGSYCRNFLQGECTTSRFYELQVLSLNQASLIEILLSGETYVSNPFSFNKLLSFYPFCRNGPQGAWTTACELNWQAPFQVEMTFPAGGGISVPVVKGELATIDWGNNTLQLQKLPLNPSQCALIPDACPAPPSMVYPIPFSNVTNTVLGSLSVENVNVIFDKCPSPAAPSPPWKRGVLPIGKCAPLAVAFARFAEVSSFANTVPVSLPRASQQSSVTPADVAADTVRRCRDVCFQHNTCPTKATYLLQAAMCLIENGLNPGELLNRTALEAWHPGWQERCSADPQFNTTVEYFNSNMMSKFVCNGMSASLVGCGRFESVMLSNFTGGCSKGLRSWCTVCRPIIGNDLFALSYVVLIAAAARNSLFLLFMSLVVGPCIAPHKLRFKAWFHSLVLPVAKKRKPEIRRLIRKYLEPPQKVALGELEADYHQLFPDSSVEDATYTKFYTKELTNGLRLRVRNVGSEHVRQHVSQLATRYFAMVRKKPEKTDGSTSSDDGPSSSVMMETALESLQPLTTGSSSTQSLLESTQTFSGNSSQSLVLATKNVDCEYEADIEKFREDAMGNVRTPKVFAHEKLADVTMEQLLIESTESFVWLWVCVYLGLSSDCADCSRMERYQVTFFRYINSSQCSDLIINSFISYYVLGGTTPLVVFIFGVVLLLPPLVTNMVPALVVFFPLTLAVAGLVVLPVKFAIRRFGEVNNDNYYKYCGLLVFIRFYVTSLFTILFQASFNWGLLFLHSSTPYSWTETITKEYTSRSLMCSLYLLTRAAAEKESFVSSTIQHLTSLAAV